MAREQRYRRARIRLFGLVARRQVNRIFRQSLSWTARGAVRIVLGFHANSPAYFSCVSNRRCRSEVLPRWSNDRICQGYHRRPVDLRHSYFWRWRTTGHVGTRPESGAGMDGRRPQPGFWWTLVVEGPNYRRIAGATSNLTEWLSNLR